MFGYQEMLAINTLCSLVYHSHRLFCTINLRNSKFNTEAKLERMAIGYWLLVSLSGNVFYWLLNSLLVCPGNLQNYSMHGKRKIESSFHEEQDSFSCLSILVQSNEKSSCVLYSDRIYVLIFSQRSHLKT